MDGNRRIVLKVSPELFGRIEARAAEERREGVNDWALRTLIVALLPPPDTALCRAQEELRAMRIVNEILEGRPHAAHP